MRLESMRKIIAFLLIAVFITVLSSCDNSNTDGLGKEYAFIWNGENAHPIAAVYKLTEENIENVYFSGSQFAEGRFPFDYQEQYTLLINDLRKLELLGKANHYDTSKAKNTLCYEIQLKNAKPIVLNFYDNVVDFGKGCYFYKSADNSVVPDGIEWAEIGFPEFNSSAYYHDSCDIEDLLPIFSTLENTDISVQEAEDFSELMNICFVSNNGTIEVVLLYVKAENETYYLFKEFLTLYIYVGEISKAGYDSLILACKAQFGTHKHFSVTSGETTIYPLGHPIYALTYNEQTGGGMNTCAFPSLGETDKLESVRYAPNFALWSKYENTEFRILIAGTYTELTDKVIETLPAGEYIITCEVTVLGKYVEKAKDYNRSACVYWFKLIKP